MSQHPPPVRERIVLADALRGFALMGLFIVHMVEYFELYWYKPEPGWIHNTIFFLFGGKAYGVFALLFGLSFFIILDNYRQRGIDFRWRFSWRLLLLLGFGYLHSILYAGDILQLLALCGFLLLLTQRLATRWLIAIAGFFLIQIPHLVIITMHAIQPSSDYTQPLFYGLMANNFDHFAHADLGKLLQYNLAEGQVGKWAFFLETGRFWNIIGLMYAGAVLGRMGFFEKKQHALNRLILIFSGSWVVFGLLKIVSPYFLAFMNDGMARWSLEQLFAYYGNLAAITAGVVFFILVFQWSVGKKLLSLFAFPGRLTLSFYVGQSLIFVPVYYGFGLGAYDYLGQFWSLMAGVVFWLLQMLLAYWWLNHFRYGPLEWVWRKLTFVYFNAPEMSAGRTISSVTKS